MIPRLLARRARQSTTLCASKNANASVTSLLSRHENFPSIINKQLSTSQPRRQGHKTYFQPGDQPITATPPQYQTRNQPPSSTDFANTSTQADQPSRARKAFRGLAWLIAGSFLGSTVVDQLMKNGILPASPLMKLRMLSSEHDEAASGIMELFSLLLLHIRNTGTLWDSYRDMDLLDQVPLILADGTRATNENAAVVRVVDALGRTRFLLLAVDTNEPPPSFREIGSNSWVSESTPIQQWLLKLSNKIYTESNGEAVGLTLGYFTRDTMGFGPVGNEGMGGQVVLQCFKYDAEDSAGFGSMVDVLKDVKVEKEDLPELEDEPEEASDADGGVVGTKGEE